LFWADVEPDGGLVVAGDALLEDDGEVVDTLILDDAADVDFAVVSEMLIVHSATTNNKAQPVDDLRNDAMLISLYQCDLCFLLLYLTVLSFLCH